MAYHSPQTERVLVAFVFAKNAASTLTARGQGELARAAALVLAANDRELTVLLVSGTVEEVMCDAIEQG